MAGGKSDSVGVVFESEPVKAAPVAAPVAARKRRYCGFPWEVNDHQEVPHALRTYTFSWTDGGVAVLPEAWTVERDARHRITGHSKTDVPYANALNFPEMNFKTAKAMQEMSSLTGCSLKVAFAKLYDMNKLPPEQLDKIAVAPEMYAQPSKAEAVATSKKRIADDFWNEVKAK